MWLVQGFTSVSQSSLTVMVGFNTVGFPCSIDLVSHLFVRSLNAVSILMDILSPFFSELLVGLSSSNVFVHNFLWVAIVKVSPLIVGSSWSSIGLLRFLVFNGVNVLVSDTVSGIPVVSGFLFEVVLKFVNSDGISVDSFDDFSVELKSIVEVSFDVSLHSLFSSMVFGFNDCEEGCNNKCGLFHFGLVFLI